MPKNSKYERCIRDVKKKIKKGDIKKTYMRNGKRYSANAYALCSKLRRKK